MFDDFGFNGGFDDFNSGMNDLCIISKMLCNKNYSSSNRINSNSNSSTVCDSNRTNSSSR